MLLVSDIHLFHAIKLLFLYINYNYTMSCFECRQTRRAIKILFLVLNFDILYKLKILN